MRCWSSLLYLVVGTAALLAVGCGARGNGDVLDEAKAAGKTELDFPAADYDYFRDMDQAVRIGPDGKSLGLQRLDLAGDEIKGRNTWMMWCGGNEAFWAKA
jgi:hypothetical protein